MIIVRVDLDSANGPHRDARLFTLLICNDGSGNRYRGNYNVFAGKRGVTDLASITLKPWKRGRVEQHPRTSQHTIHLIQKAIEAVI